ncbi:MAG: hypothetical protein ACYDGM_10205 [Vulcanimicrobiaceae bacterium]
MNHIRTGWAAVALALSFFIGVGIASAQTTPAGTKIADATAKPAPAKKKPAKTLAVIHLQPQLTFETGGANLPRPDSLGGANGNFQYTNGTLRLNYGAQVFLGKKLFINYAHFYINQNIGTVTTKTGAPVYQVFNDDRVDDVSLNYPIGPVMAAVGFHQRVRQCCGNPNQTAAGEVGYHLFYIQGGTRFGPNSKFFGKLVGLTLNLASIPHNSAQVFTDPSTGGAIPAEGNKLKLTYIGNITLPIGNPKTSTFAAFLNYLNNYDYFNSAPFMYLYNQTDFGFIKKFSSAVTLQATDSNLYQHQQGFPFVPPNTINRAKLLITLDYAIPIKQ